MLTRSVDLVQLAMTALWMLVGVAFAVLFIVKYKATPTGILGLLGSVGHALAALGYSIVPMLMGPVFGPDQVRIVLALLQGLNLVSSGLVFVAILLAPGLRRQSSAA
jgi:hypothetical protein